jgi:hypothetical protein
MAEDLLALHGIEGNYGYLYDSRQAEAWAALFTEDGIYQGRQLAGMPPQNWIQGRENLRRFCQSSPMNGMHFVHAPHFTVSGDSATGRVHFQYLAFGADPQDRTRARALSGYYDVAYARAASGWLIRRRVTTYFEIFTGERYGYEPVPADLSPVPVGPGATYSDRR